MGEVNNPEPGEPIQALKWIGPYLGRRFEEIGGCKTLQDVLDRLGKHTKKSNTKWLKNILTNERPGECVGDVSKGQEYGRDHRYSVREVNWYGYNSVLTYARGRMSRGQYRLLPSRLAGRKAGVAFPDRC